MQTQETSGRLFGPDGKALTPVLAVKTIPADAQENDMLPSLAGAWYVLALNVASSSSVPTTLQFPFVGGGPFGDTTASYTLPAYGQLTLPYNQHGWLHTMPGNSLRVINGTIVDHTEGPSAPGTAASANGDGTLGWVNPNNIKADDTSFATANSSSGTDTTKWILGTNFGFATIPDAATVTRIVVSVKRKAITLADGFVIDLNAQFFITGAAVGGNFALESHWDTTEETVIYDTAVGSVPTEVSTGANVKDATFGFGIEASIASTMSVIAGVQYMTVAVHWNTIDGSAVEVCGVYVNRTV